MKRKILLTGATAGTNFGDCLFAEMFQKEVADIVGFENVYWYKTRYSMSDYFEKQLNYTRRYKNLKSINGLVYISGGYFCGNDKNWKDYLFRFLRYFVVGLKCIIYRIPYIIVAVEVGPTKNKLIELIEKIILRNAKLLIVRNNTSKHFAKVFGCSRIVETADSVFAMEKSIFNDSKLPIEFCNNEKKLFLHIEPSKMQNKIIIDKIIPVINEFTKAHSDYTIVLGTDQYYDNQQITLDYVKSFIKTDKVIGVPYSTPFTLCKILDNVDVIVTHKLHVGIVGAKLEKSVISFSGHTEKIHRLYEQLGILERTYPLSSLTTEKGVEMLEEWHMKKILVPDHITNLAKSNFKMLSEFILNKI